MSKEITSGWDFHDKFIIIHAVFASMATLLTAPLAILAARYFRRNRSWFLAHAILQTLTCLFVIIAFVLSAVAVRSSGNGWQFTGPHMDLHHDFGLAVFILVLVEGVIGLLAHYTRTLQFPGATRAFPTLTARKSPVRRIHVAFGIIIAGLLYALLYTGLNEWDMVSDAGTFVPRGVRVMFWIIFAIEVAAYAVGWTREAILRPRRARAEAESVEKTDESGSTQSKSEARRSFMP
ncbi:hypothetical protein BD779DRAFT_1473212 [Infundibulicybe gibba]|nr:hypothetical protein BD779DRAFT_1473212 [Infundibulicybe gibba]